MQAAGDQAGLEALADEFVSPWSAAQIDMHFASVATWSTANSCPVILNEFGVLNFCVDAASRANWIRAVRQAAEDHEVGWTYWEADQGFGFIADRASTDGFDDSAIGALLS